MSQYTERHLTFRVNWYFKVGRLTTDIKNLKEMNVVKNVNLEIDSEGGISSHTTKELALYVKVIIDLTYEDAEYMKLGTMLSDYEFISSKDK